MLNVCFPAEKYSKTGDAVRKKPGKRAQKSSGILRPLPGTSEKIRHRIYDGFYAGTGWTEDSRRRLLKGFPRHGKTGTPPGIGPGIIPAAASGRSAIRLFTAGPQLLHGLPFFPTPVFSGGNEKPPYPVSGSSLNVKNRRMKNYG
ncbi:MAG: hypothetical protein C6W56_10200 [Caldibacillus debilis]|nr:MAG: hypothetical protein C6W56_10200 [Caldibacillus debilis]